jgi:hypothetical protein
MKLTRQQELSLIDLGLKSLLDGLDAPKVREPYKKRPWNKGKKIGRWTTERRRKFSETMKKKWANKDK